MLYVYRNTFHMSQHSFYQNRLHFNNKENGNWDAKTNLDTGLLQYTVHQFE